MTDKKTNKAANLIVDKIVSLVEIEKGETEKSVSGYLYGIFIAESIGDTGLSIRCGKRYFGGVVDARPARKELRRLVDFALAQL